MSFLTKRERKFTHKNKGFKGKTSKNRCMTIYFERVKRLHFLIKMRATGSRVDLADKMEISVSTLQDTIRFMKEWLGAPIEYDKFNKTYFYRYKGVYLDFGYDDVNNYEELINDLKSAMKRFDNKDGINKTQGFSTGLRAGNVEQEDS